MGSLGVNAVMRRSRHVRLAVAICSLACPILEVRSVDAPADAAPPGKMNTAVLPSTGGGETWRARNDAINARVKEGHVDLIYIGDSIVRSWMWDGQPVWDHYYAKRNGVIMGMTGDRTEQVLWRLQHGHLDGISPKLAIVMIGQNKGPFNTGEEIAAGETAIVQTLRERLPATKILLLAIFPRGEKPTQERAVLAKANEIASKLADGKHIFYMDVNYLFLRPDGGVSASVMPDFEHPNEVGHRVWAATVEPMVAQLMGDAPTAEMTAKARPAADAAK
jgi:beta-glucosidase